MEHQRQRTRHGRLGRTATTATAALALLTACAGSAPDQQAAPIERAVVAQGEFAEAEDALLRSAFRLGALMTSDPDANQVTSPLSALYALSMLRAGAGTTTAAEMDAVLGLPAEHRDEAMNALLASVQRFDGNPGDVDEDDPPETPVLHLANAVFVPDSGGIGEAYLETLARQYGSGVYPVDFRDGSTAGRIDDWVSKETGGRIEKAPIEVGPGTTLSLLNAVYFAAAWDEPFDASGTSDQDFVLVDRRRVAVPMMHGTRTVRYVEGDGWNGIDLPYGDGFFMRLILPAEGSPPRWTEQELLDMAFLLDTAEDVRVELSLPKWNHEFEQDLRKPLAAAGLDESFGPEADFRAIQPGSFVDGAAQVANITVAEKGTIAAAVTQLTMAGSAPMPPDVSISFDRPFGYQLVHEETGLPVFLGTVADPR
ncbi:serpin family protein [Arthrobacter sp. MDT2-2]